MNENTTTYATSNVISLEDFIEREHPTRFQQARYMADNARTSIMMFKATGDKRYEERAKQEIQQGKDILNGFVRPLGVILHQT